VSNCTGRFAEAWEYAIIVCVGAVIKRIHTGADGAAVLTDSQVDFVTGGVLADVGMVLYNVTDGSSGAVTAVTPHTLTATLTGGTDNDWDAGDVYRIVTINALEIATIEQYLDIAASDVHSALAASGACDCTLASWATAYLKKLNIYDALSYYLCPCGKVKMSDEARAAYLAWAENQFSLLRKGEIEVCAGETGSDFPALDWADQSVTEFAAARIISNDVDRNS
jgi:hypothetical protein